MNSKSNIFPYIFMYGSIGRSTWCLGVLTNDINSNFPFVKCLIGTSSSYYSNIELKCLSLRDFGDKFTQSHLARNTDFLSRRRVHSRWNYLPATFESALWVSSLILYIMLLNTQLNVDSKIVQQSHKFKKNKNKIIQDSFLIEIMSKLY